MVCVCITFISTYPGNTTRTVYVVINSLKNIYVLHIKK